MKSTEHTPNPLLDPMLPALQSTALVTAAAIGLFAALADGPLTATGLAARLRCDPTGILRLTEFLAAAGYLVRQGDRFGLNAITRATCTTDGEMPLTHWLRFCGIQLAALGQLTESIQDGRAVDLFDLMSGPEARLTHQRAMAQTARPAAEWVADQVPVPKDARRLLDVGGAHGIYSAAICRRHPPLAAEVLELPDSLASATRVAHEFGCSAHVTHRPGDIRTTTLEGRYAVVFLGNLIHHFPPEILAEVLAKLVTHLDPGGTIAIWDLAMAEGTADPVAAGFALFFYLTSGAGCHPSSALTAALEAAGFAEIAVARPPQGTTHMLVTARRI
ncbi:MAG: class I SAM-dependent methyltransferase [Desulfosarcinaceae bacterium]|nr:class I SAM-dependent methyltransferase [Desulfosarcinaceae bacterium]